MLDSLFQDQFESLQALLKVVGLESLERRAGGMHAEVTWDWYTVLSQGELQRLAFARLFYHNPRYAGTSQYLKFCLMLWQFWTKQQALWAWMMSCICMAKQ